MGGFTAVGGAPRQNLAAVDVATGAVTGFAPKPRAAIRQVAVSGDGARVFVAVAGDRLRGNRIQAFNTSSGSLAWEQAGDGDFQAVDFAGSTVYAGGHFTMVGAEARLHLAAFDAATGALDPWNPGANSVNGIYALAVTPTRLYAGGEFTVIGGVSQPRFAQFSGTP